MCPIKNFIKVTWSNLQRRTINGARPEWTSRNMVRDYLSKGIELRMTRNEFAYWCHGQRDKILSLISDSDSPSVDRLDSRGHYELTNMRIISWTLNRQIAASERRNSVNRAIADLPPKYCLVCGKRLTRNSYRDGWREAVSKFKKRLTCGLKCKYGKRMSELQEIHL